MVKMVNMYEEIILTEIFFNMKIQRWGTVGYDTIGWKTARRRSSIT